MVLKLLAALCNAEQIDFLTDLTKSSIDNQIVTVQSYEQFILKMEGTYDRIAVHCDLFQCTYPWEWMVDLKIRQPQARIMIALSTKSYDSIYNDVITRLAVDFDFTIVPLGLSEQEIAEKFAQGLLNYPLALPSKRAALITLISASSKDGATTLAVNTALTLAKTTSLKIGLLDLNLKAPDIKDNFNIAQARKSLFSLRPKLNSNSITSVDLMEHCYTYKGFKNLYLLLGSHRRDTAGDLTIEQMKNLIDVARRTFDIVIADVHTFADNAATIYAIKHADHRWIVTQPNYVSFKSSWVDWYDCYWRHCGLEKDSFSLIVNRMSVNSGMKASAIEADLGIKLLGVISNVMGGVGIKAVNEGLPLLLAENNGAFTKEMNVIASRLLERIGIEFSDAPSDNKQAFGFLSKIVSVMTAKL